MLARMDIISVNCPHTPATFHLLSARRLKLLRPQAIVVNTSRGEVIDEAALTRMLHSREIAGAGLDVFEHEPAINPKLRQLDNVVLLPHMSSATIEGRLDMGEKVLINIKTFVDGHRPPDRVLPRNVLSRTARRTCHICPTGSPRLRGLSAAHRRHVLGLVDLQHGPFDDPPDRLAERVVERRDDRLHRAVLGAAPCSRPRSPRPTCGAAAGPAAPADGPRTSGGPSPVYSA